VRLLLIAAAVLVFAAPAAAQSPAYGGGLLPAASAPRGYTPTMGIVLQPRAGTIAIRFDTSLRCGPQTYEQPAGRVTVPFDGRSFSASKSRRHIRLVGGRVTYSWKLSGQLDGTIATGTLRITGVERRNGRRVSCRRKPLRRFAARVAGAPAGAPRPPARAAFGGVSDMRVGGLPAPVVLKVGSTARRLGARWTARAACGDGRPLIFANFSPPMRIRPDGSFSRSERFAVHFSDALIRYRVRFAGRFSGEAATGVVRARARIYNRSGSRLRTRCDSGTRTWSAGRLP
jgi:hypothetical protein